MSIELVDGTSIPILDADGHLVERGGLFDRWAPPGELPMDLPAATPMEPCGDLALVADQLEAGFDGPSQLRAMDLMGVDAAVVYPSLGLYVPFLPTLTLDQSADACGAYRHWALEWAAADDRRLFPAGILPLAEPAAAAAEVLACADAGMVAVVVRPNHIGGRGLDDPDLDPVWAACAETGVVAAIHEGLGLRSGSTAGSDRFETFAARHACSHPLEQQQAMVGLMFGGVFERFETLRVAFLESGTGWLPWWLHRLDEHHEWMAGSELAHLSLRPSEYFARQCMISSEADDEFVGQAVQHVGHDHVAWASDYPHPDAAYPTGATDFVEMLGRFDPSQSQVIDVMWRAPVAFYGLSERVAPPAGAQKADRRGPVGS